MVVVEEVVELIVFVRIYIGLGIEGVVVKGDGGNVVGDGDGGVIDINDGGERIVVGWFVDVGVEGDVFVVDGYVDLDVVFVYGIGDVVGGWWVDIEFILLYDFVDFFLVVFKVGFGGDFLFVGVGEWIGEFGIVLGWVVGLDGVGLMFKDFVGGSGNGKGCVGYEKGGSEMDYDDNFWEEMCC